MLAANRREADHPGPDRLAVGDRTGRFRPSAARGRAAHPRRGLRHDLPTNRIVGDGAQVVAGLLELAERTQAVELMVSTMTYGLPERIRTLELIAEHWPTG